MGEIVISLAGKLIEMVGSGAIKEICSIWGYGSELDELKDTITTIRNVLLDAESKDQLSHEEHDYVQKLKEAVYEADDLFDEFRTLVELKQRNKNNKLSEKVRDFFSTKNKLSVAYSMSWEIKKIRKKLVVIVSNHNTFSDQKTFGFSADSKHIRERREETCSYVYSNEVVGREFDLNKVVDMLLDSGSQDGVSFLSIFGIGGLGKTTLAQLVFNNDIIKTKFPLRLWTCVSDESGEVFDVKTILYKMLESASNDKHDGLTMDLVHKKLLGFLGGKRYLIVLDDVWNEDREKWLGLRQFLMGGGGGSRVLVTTRSERTAMIVDEKYKYELKGLSPAHSWRLFEMTAFGENGGHDENFSELNRLGEKIIEQCCNVPLAIKVVGTLLYGQSVSKWRSIQECGFAKLNNGDNKIMSILKLSYDNLESPLQTCFSYCAIFPKDFRINKEKLIRLWMAQGYIIPFDVGQSLEDAGDEYISILLRRCFYQDVRKNEIGGVESFKIHDLIHDVAQKVVGKGVVAVRSIQTNLGDKAHHLFHIGSKSKGGIFLKCRIRSYVRDGYEMNFSVAKLVENWKFLRTLDLHDLDIRILPNSIGKLLHLRFLDLSKNMHLMTLPDSVTNLFNLQILDLKQCEDLIELPKGLTKLANLSHLDTSGCYRLRMPSDLNKLSCLCVLTNFVVGEGSSMVDLENLLALKKLRGRFEIRIKLFFMGAVRCRGGYLRSLNLLEVLNIRIEGDGHHQSWLEKLEPPRSLKKLCLSHYHGAKLPLSWRGMGEEIGNWATFLPNLVHLEIFDFTNLLYLPSLSKLMHLKSLVLDFMDKLEYVEDSTQNDANRDVFFPSLEKLQISHTGELRGWWRGGDIDSCFSRLSELKIYECEKLTSFPACISLEKLALDSVNKELWITSLGQENDSIKLREVRVDNLDYLRVFNTEGLTSICIAGNHDIENLSELEETLKGCCSLRSLRIDFCAKLSSLEGTWWDHLTALDSLQLSLLHNLTFSGRTKDGEEEEEEDGVPWRSIGGRLRSLEFVGLGMETVAQGMRHLTSLENLAIRRCNYFTSLPVWIRCWSSLRSLCIHECSKFELNAGIMQDLTSLQHLEVMDCPLTTERFGDPHGEDWAHLRHIPSVDIRSL